jgi:hypothetical protein
MKRADLWRHLDALIGPTILRNDPSHVASDVARLAIVLSETREGSFSIDEAADLDRLRSLIQPGSGQTHATWLTNLGNPEREEIGTLITRLHERMAGP